MHDVVVMSLLRRNDVALHTKYVVYYVNNTLWCKMCEVIVTLLWWPYIKIVFSITSDLYDKQTYIPGGI